ncbi:MAG: arylsulfatase [Sedimentisphaerales bacterium]
MDRRSFLKTVGLGTASLLMHGCEGPSRRPADTAPADIISADGPNIVFIIVDDMGWMDLGCYGSRHIKTPNINMMAVEGMRFMQAYSGCTVCAPARSVLMTGLHMGHTSVRGNTGGIPLLDEDITVAELLKRVGYTTGGFGKWGLGEVGTTGVPEKQGFDEFFGYYHQVHAHDYWTPYLWQNSQKVPITGEQGTAERYSHNWIFMKTLDFISRNKDRRFFCYAPWTPPHGKYQIPESDPAWQMYKDKPWPQNAKVAAAMDTMLDRHVGQLLTLLKELNLDERTIVFFVSDNGAAQRFDGVLDSCGPLRGSKRSMYEGGIRVPMIVRWPGRIKPATMSNLPCYFADVMPTLLDLAGVSKITPSNTDGLSIVPTLTGQAEKQKKHEFMYWEWHKYNWGKRKNIPDGLMQAVRMGDWKAVRHSSNVPFELYNLNRDISEKANLAANYPDIIAQIENFVATARTDPRPQIEPQKPAGRQYM